MKTWSIWRSAAAAAVLVAALTGCPQRQPVPAALFVADTQLGDGPLTVQFTDMSVPEKQASLTAWSWDFGDGATSTEQNPEHTYTDPGTYTVALTVTSSNGSTATRTNLNMINVLDTERVEGTVAGEVATFNGIEFVWIPPGTFTMGDGDPNYPEPDALPQHEVTITRGFWMSRFEITQGQWEDVLGERPSFFDVLVDTVPVDSVSWRDAQRFVSALNALGDGVYRLPTEAEWEYACRAGTATEFSFGNDEADFGDYGWALINSPFSPQVTGELMPNAWGLYDMHGNIEEWVYDYYASDFGSDDPQVDPVGAPGGPFNVTKGGSYRDPVFGCTSATRAPYITGAIYDFIGLRIVRQ